MYNNNNNFYYYNKFQLLVTLLLQIRIYAVYVSFVFSNQYLMDSSLI